MESTDQPTLGNLASIIKGIVDELTELEREKIALNEDAKEYRQEMKEKGWPVTELIALAKSEKEESDADRAEAFDRYNRARGMLGLTILSEGDRGTTDADARQRAVEVVRIGAEVKEITKTQKDRLKAAKKDHKLAPRILKQLVQFQIDPEKWDGIKQSNTLLEAYVDAYDSVS
jgi:uncharacterized protein (UPF0335 family)